MTTRLCTRQETHSGSPVFGICLEESCEDSPLACKLCAKQFHQGHLIVSLDYLEKSYQKAEVPSKLNSLISKYDKEGGKLQKQVEMSSSRMAEVSSKLFERIYNQIPLTSILSHPFKLAHIPELVQYISSSKSLFSLQTMKRLLPLLRSYYFYGGYDLSQMQEEREQTSQHLLDLFLNAERSILATINNLDENISRYCKENQKICEDVVKQEEVFSSFLKGSQNKLLVPEQMVKEEDQSDKTEEEQHRDILKRFNLARSSEEGSSKVVLRETRQAKINVLIHYIDVQSIRELTLANSACPIVVDNKAIDQIAKMVSLQVLRLFWTQQLKDVDACRMTKFMTDLRQLCLSEFKDCSKIFINALKINNPKLKKLCFSTDIHHFVRYSEENIEFMPDTAFQFQDEETWIVLTSGLQQLTTVELHHPENKPYWTNYIKQNSNRLTEFTLSNNDQTKTTGKKIMKEYSYTPLFKVLQLCTSLRCLRFEQIHFDEKILVKVVEKNPKLQTFMAHECACISNKTYSFIAKTCTQIQEFSIQMDDKFNIEVIAPMQSIKTLILRGCWGFKENQFIDVIAKMSKIKCLSIDYNYEWVTSKTLAALGKMPNLKVLNISGNNLTADQIQPLNQVPHLNALICHNNCFSYSDIASFSFSKTLKKLSIGRVKRGEKEGSIQKVNMSLLVESFPTLTHLKLRGFKSIKPQFMELLPRLICLTVVETHECEIVEVEKYCRDHDIYFNENKEE